MPKAGCWCSDHEKAIVCPYPDVVARAQRAEEQRDESLAREAAVRADLAEAVGVIDEQLHTSPSPESVRRRKAFYNRVVPVRPSVRARGHTRHLSD